ncbi:MAG: hypothetical protein SF029_09995 [bacterium]|nr:hypothetical protein [bacterium]
MVSTERSAIHEAVDGLKTSSLQPLAAFIKYLQQSEQEEGSLWAQKLYDLFAPAREAVLEMSEDEINQLLDEELEAVRPLQAN